jgi:hypothetical protein
MVGLLGALLLGNFEQETRRWGWVAGALVAAVGYPLGQVKVTGGAWITSHHVDAKEPEPAPPAESRAPPRVLPFALGGIFGMLAGLILGAFVGTALVFAWVSLALSPLPLEAWRADIATGFMHFTFHSVDTPLTLLCVGAAPFALLGLILGVAGQARAGFRVKP